jgi:UDPglucose--hexose-1-phosphate uridylyltransferase
VSSHRFDELSGTWVTIASERGRVPLDASFAAARVTIAPSSDACPFCPGRESETEATVSVDHGGDGAWRVRVVRNRFPIVSPEPDVATTSHGRELPGIGVHELVIEARAHHVDLTDFDAEHIAAVVRMYRDRHAALEAMPHVRCVAMFRNRGRLAGGSQAHPHAQIVATRMLPTNVEARQRIARAHAERTGGSLLHDLLSREMAAATRIVETNDAFVTLCPFAPHRAYETWIVPRAQVPSFADVADAHVPLLASALQSAVRRAKAVTQFAAYNLVVRTPPVDGRAERGAAWHLEILPRTGGDAGFELTTGIDVVPVSPENAARELRDALPR